MTGTSMQIQEWIGKFVDDSGEDLVREMLRVFAETLMSAEVDARCGAAYGERSEDRAEPGGEVKSDTAPVVQASAGCHPNTRSRRAAVAAAAGGRA